MPALVNVMGRYENDIKVQKLSIACIRRFRQKLGPEVASALTGAVLRSMRIHSDHATVQSLGCKALLCFLSAVAREYWPPVTVLQAMNNHSQNRDVQASACWLLARMFLEVIDDEQKAAFFRQGFIQAVVQAIKNHRNDHEVPRNACTFLDVLLRGETMAPSFIQAGGVQVILETIRLRTALRLGLSCLIGVLLSVLPTSTQARRIAIAEGGFSILVGVMSQCASLALTRTHIGPLYDLLSQLFLESDSESIAREITNLGGTKTIVDTLVALAEKNTVRLTDNDVLARLAMSALTNGMFPLHYAAVCYGNTHDTPKGQVAVVEHLLDVYPEAAEIRDGTGRLPFHIAVEANAHLSVIKHLLQVHPEALHTCDGVGRLPLHIAVEAKVSLSLLEYLMTAFLGATKVCDGRNRLPVHVAVEVNASLEVLDALLRVDPPSGEAPYIRRYDAMLNFPPLLIAATNDCDLDIILTLLRSFPTTLKSHATATVDRKRKSRG